MSVTLHNRAAFATRPAAVLFDFDNTLYACGPCNEAGLDAVRRKAEQVLSVRGDQFDVAFDDARRQVKQRLGATASAHSRLLYFQRTIELLGLHTQALLVLDFEQTFWRAYLRAGRLYDEAVDLLDDLRISGVPTALVTDLTAQIQFRKIIYFGLEHAFDYVVTSEEAGADKPAEAPYRLVLDKLGVNDRTVWMIGDSISGDVDGAKRSIGAVTLLKRHDGGGRRHDGSVADLVFDDFADLRRFVRPLLTGTGHDAQASAAAG